MTLKIGRFGPTKKGRTDEKNILKRNCVEPELGLHIFNCAFREKQRTIEELK